jgi:hypothetical protein
MGRTRPSMNKSEVEQLLLDMWNNQGRKWHEELLRDKGRVEEYRKYSWFTESFEPDEELDWGELIDEINDQEFNGYELKSVEHLGGEGQGDHIHWVFTITDQEGNVEHWKRDGYYASYSGTDWSYGDLCKVTPKTKQVTVYE